MPQINFHTAMADLHLQMPTKIEVRLCENFFHINNIKTKTKPAALPRHSYESRLCT